MPPPLIILGMHRSGTTMVARLLAELGLFLGDDLEVNFESLFFQRLNECVFFLAGARWDWPEPVLEALERPESRSVLTSDFRRIVGSPALARFTGRRLRLRGRRSPPSRPWGFKDPRSTFLLPVWLDVFPEARVLHVQRDGVDVAASLRKRAREAMKRRSTWIRPRDVRSRRRWPRVDLERSTRCLTLEGAFALWRSYVARGHETRQLVSEGQWLAVGFEKLLTSPEEHIRRLADFAGLSTTPDRIDELVATLRPERAGAWKLDEDLREFHGEVGEDPWMRNLGYGDA
jgi:hypothetical protein